MAAIINSCDSRNYESSGWQWALKQDFQSWNSDSAIYQLLGKNYLTSWFVSSIIYKWGYTYIQSLT
jgi:hypothetical protein